MSGSRQVPSPVSPLFPANRRRRLSVRRKAEMPRKFGYDDKVQGSRGLFGPLSDGNPRCRHDLETQPGENRKTPLQASRN